MRRSWLAMVLAATLLGGCGEQTDKTPPPPGVEDGVFVGQIEGTDALVALIVEGDSVTAYTCGGEASWQALTGWFETSVEGNALEPATGGWELELRGQYEAQVWSGTLTVDGRALAWTASRALTDRPAGLYVLDTETREAGLIVGNDLATAGVYYGKASEQTAPVRVEGELSVGTGQPDTMTIFTEAYGGRTFTLQRVRRPIRTPRISPERQLRQALARALPGLRRYSLIAFDDGSLLKELHELARNPSTRPRHLELPVVDGSGNLTSLHWTVYHHDVRDPKAQSCIFDPARGTAECQPLPGPSLTFQGMPDLAFGEFRELLHRAQKEPEVVARELLDEEQYQLSTLGIIGSELVGTYGGLALETPSVIQGLRSIFEVAYGASRAAELMDLTAHNYLVYNRFFYDEPLEMPAPPEVPQPQHHVHARDHHDHRRPRDRPHQDRATPQRHFDEFDDWSILRPMMVADATIWDADTQTWLVDTFFERADYAANVQDNAFNWLQVFADAPAGSSTLDQWSNALAVRTKIGGYWRLTPHGQSLLNYPDTGCGGADSFIDEVRKLSPNSKSLANEYWAWWTNHEDYGLGCAYTGTLGNTGRDYAVSWQHISSQTLDATASTFMHETGHIMDGTHGPAGGPHPTARTSHRCRLIGILPVGPTGPSLMHQRIAGTTRTNCFAATLPDDTTKMNMTRIAEHTHDNLE